MRPRDPSLVRTRVRFHALVLALAACGPHRAHPDDGGNGSDDAPSKSHDDATQPRDASPHDAAADATMLDAFPSVLDVKIQCRNDCVLVAHPPSISVSAGTEFEVNWINVGDAPCDVAKIDQFNQVPIVLDLEPGTSYHDSVHKWCGTLFTGTFQFRIDICTIASYIPVNCGA